MTLNNLIKELFLKKDNKCEATITADYGPYITSSSWANTTTTGGVYTYPYTSTAGSTSGNTLTITYPGSTGYWGNGTTVYPIATPYYPWPNQEVWPAVTDGIGIVFVEGDLIKLKTKNGKEVVIGKLNPDDETEVIPLEVIIAKKKLLEGTKEENEA